MSEVSQAEILKMNQEQKKHEARVNRSVEDVRKHLEEVLKTEFGNVDTETRPGSFFVPVPGFNEAVPVHVKHTTKGDRSSDGSITVTARMLSQHKTVSKLVKFVDRNKGAVQLSEKQYRKVIEGIKVEFEYVKANASLFKRK